MKVTINYEELAYRFGLEQAIDAIKNCKVHPDAKPAFVKIVEGLLTSKPHAAKWRKLNPKPSRDDLGRMVRETSVSAIQKLKCHLPPRHVVPYGKLTDHEREMYRQVGDVLFEAGYVAMRDKLVDQLRMDAKSIQINADAVRKMGMKKEARARELSGIHIEEWARLYAMYGEIEKLGKLEAETKDLLASAKKSGKKHRKHKK